MTVLDSDATLLGKPVIKGIYPWLVPYRREWQKLAFQKQLPHAVLIRGISGSGKKALALALAADLLCESALDQGHTHEACGECAGCQLLAAGNHPDFYAVMPLGQFIKVTQIREVSSALSLSAHRGGYKVVIIESAGQMNLAAANALLKTLEEPADRTCLVLIAAESDRLLPTIASRCRLMPVKPPAASALAQWLGKTDNITQQALIVSGGAPLLAKEWLMADRLANFMQLMNDLASLISNTGQDRIMTIAQQWQDVLDDQWWQALYRYLLHLQAVYAGVKEPLPGEHALVNQMAPVLHNSEIMRKKMQQLAYLRQHWSSVLKKGLLFEEFLINWSHSALPESSL